MGHVNLFFLGFPDRRRPSLIFFFGGGGVGRINSFLYGRCNLARDYADHKPCLFRTYDLYVISPLTITRSLKKLSQDEPASNIDYLPRLFRGIQLEKRGLKRIQLKLSTCFSRFSSTLFAACRIPSIKSFYKG